MCLFVFNSIDLFSQKRDVEPNGLSLNMSKTWNSMVCFCTCQTQWFVLECAGGRKALDATIVSRIPAGGTGDVEMCVPEAQLQ